MLTADEGEKRNRRQGENEKARSYKQASFSKGENERLAMAFDAETMYRALCKPWELGGHPHDFLVSHRSARSTDLYQHYERDKVLMQRHERLVAEKESWNRQRELREDMLHLLTKLHSIEKQRRHFIDVRNQHHSSNESGLERSDDIFKEEHSNITIGAVNLANTFFQKRPNRAASRFAAAENSSPNTLLSANCITEDASHGNIYSAETVTAMQEVKALDVFEEKLENAASQKKVVPVAAPGSAASFPKKKKK